jgi:hypothetical protein
MEETVRLKRGMRREDGFHTSQAGALHGAISRSRILTWDVQWQDQFARFDVRFI